MTNTFSNNLRKAAVAAMMAVPLLAIGAPAKPGIVSITTPDGLELRLEKRGGPFNHATFTDDGLLLAEMPDGTYVYAQIGKNGMPEPTMTMAHAPEFRSAGELKIVDELRKLDMAEALRVRDAAINASMGRNGVIKRERAKNPGLNKTTMPNHIGSPKCLVILVEFQDEKFRNSNPYEYYNGILNEPGFKSAKWEGSALDYFRENSMGKYTPQFDVYGPVTVSKSMRYYGENSSVSGGDAHPVEMVVEACRILNETSDINFADYDNDGDGEVDNIFIYYAGFGEANSTGKPDTIWPHSFNMSESSEGRNIEIDGVRLNHYACCNEVAEKSPGTKYWKTEGIGTFIHEFSHVLGLPDLYVTTYASGSYTPKYYQVMDIGIYNNDGHTPPNYSAYERYAMGWINPKPLFDSGDKTLPPLPESNVAYILDTDKENEFFLFENRRQEGWDTYIPGEGMIVWHIDYVPSVFEANVVNNDASHNYVDMVEADNIGSFETSANDVFPGGANVRSLGANTTPNIRSWSGKDLMRELSNIRVNGRNITFHLENTDPGYVPSGVSMSTSEGAILEFGNGLLTSSVEAEVYDTLGRKVAHVNPGETVELSEGIYMVATTEGVRKIKL